MSPRRPVLLAALLLACTRPTADLTTVSAPPTVIAPDSPNATLADATQPRWVSLAIESEFGCAVERTGSVQCWGRGPAAEMGLRELPEQPPPDAMYGARRWGPASRVEFLTGARSVSTATGQACAIVEDGRVRCWGAVRWGSSHVYDVAGISGAVELQIGDGEACAQLDNRELWCWGGPDDHGIARPRLSGTVAFTVGDNLACGLGDSGDVVCWGQAIADWHRYSAQIAQQQPGNNAPVFQPNAPEQTDWPDTVDVGRFRGALDIALTGWNVLCVVQRDGAAACTSQDVAAALRNEDLGLRPIPGAAGLVELASTRTHVCGRTGDDRALCWGRNVYGQLGDGSATSRERAEPVAGLTGVVALAVAEDLSCASTRAGELRCWGLDRGEALGREPLHVHTLADVSANAIAAYGRTTCASEAGRVRCWGGDAIEPAGVVELATPRELSLPGSGDVVALSTGWEGCALRRGGELSCGNWTGPANLSVSTRLTDARAYAAALPPTCVIVGAGSKASLQCGPSFATLTTERQIAAPTRVSAANMRACVVHGGGKVSCFGELHHWGNAPTGPREVTRVEGIADAIDIASSTYHDCALRKTGAVVCWVARVDTQWSADGRSPTAIHYAAANERDIGLEKVVQVVAGTQHHCALTSTGVVRCWADNPYADTIDWRAVPDLPDDVVELAAGSEHTCARTRAGQVTCWGEDVLGSLGRVPSRVYLQPTVLPTDGPAPTP